MLKYRMALRFLNKTPFHLILIALLGLIAYSNTFDAPFQWDERYYIKENPIVKDLGHFLSAKELGPIKSRCMGYLTFALNYKLHGLDVRGYHIVNIAIHILNSLLVYFLVLLTFRTLFLNNPPSPPFAKGGLSEGNLIALFSALLFVSHPIQTEAVTYIFQRLASLCAFFYLLSLAAYIKSRLTEKKTKYAFYALSLLSAVLAMKTKENAFTLPLVIALYEFFFFRDTLKKRAFLLVPLLLTMLIIPLTLVGINKPVGEIISGIGPITEGYQEISRWDYLFTQFRVIVTYIRLLFLPISQNLDYDYPVYNSFFDLEVLLSFFFLLSVFGSAAYLFYRSKTKNPDLRLISFGVFWFFITLSVESSIIPIPMVINEYRLYLPSAGVFSAAAGGALIMIKSVRGNKLRMVIVSFFALVPLVFLYAAYARNAMWESKISLWEDVVRKSPQKARPHNILGIAYNTAGLTDRAIEHYQIALSLKPDYAEAHNNLGIVYASKGLIQKAIDYFQAALTLKPDYAGAHSNLANAYDTAGLTDKAIEHYRIALSLKPDYAEAHNNLGTAYASKGLADKAIEHFLAALRLRPDYADAHYNLGLVYLNTGDKDAARKEFEKALQLNHNYNQARQALDILR